MAWISETVDSYHISFYFQQREDQLRGTVYVRSQKGIVGQIDFFNPGTPFGAPKWDPIARRFWLAREYTDWDKIVDLLREEGPVRFMVWSEGGSAVLYTGTWEPTGEDEGK